jgi:hypothetical protein
MQEISLADAVTQSLAVKVEEEEEDIDLSDLPSGTLYCRKCGENSEQGSLSVSASGKATVDENGSPYSYHGEIYIDTYDSDWTWDKDHPVYSMECCGARSTRLDSLIGQI